MDEQIAITSIGAMNGYAYATIRPVPTQTYHRWRAGNADEAAINPALARKMGIPNEIAATIAYIMTKPMAVISQIPIMTGATAIVPIILEVTEG